MIDNDDLRTYVNNYIGLAVKKYEEEQKRNKRKISEESICKREREAFEELTRKYPQLYDYYIKYKEDYPEHDKELSFKETENQIQKLIVSSKKLIEYFCDYEKSGENMTAREEAKNRIRFFKHIIEDCDGYKNLYVNGKQIVLENDLQRLFKFVWYGTSYKLDAEPNNGRGQADFIVSKGNDNQNIIEFKLASNSKLSHVFKQVRIYEKANCSDGSLIVIFFFSDEEHILAKRIVEKEGYLDLLDESIYLIDCRKDNKISASKI